MKFRDDSGNSKASRSPASHDGPRFIDLKQAARRTNLSVSTLRRARDDGELPSYKPQGKVLLDVDEVDGWVRSSRFQGRTEGRSAGKGKPRGSSGFRREVMRRRGS